MKLRSVSSILRSKVTSEVIWRSHWPLRPQKLHLEAIHMHMDVKVIQVADFKFEGRFVLIGCLEANLVSEAIKTAVGKKTHIDIKKL